MIREWTLTLRFECGHDVISFDFNEAAGDNWDSITQYARQYYMGQEDMCNECGEYREITENEINLSNIIYMDVVEWQEHNYPGETWRRYTDASYLQRIRQKYGLREKV